MMGSQTFKNVVAAKKVVAEAAESDGTPKITVAGVTFGSDEVVSAVVKIDGREVTIAKKEEDPPRIGFKP